MPFWISAAKLQILFWKKKDNSIQKFIGFLDETYDGQINAHCDCITNDDYSTDDIKYWGYIPNEIFD